ncbi:MULTISPECIES: hypothetical protein [unclassified Devosia]|uniref:hypothetical protein n=1 Tax=unclassified Devosia TaxID=196773 RepID=UPI00145FC90D|nr:MULTISPECIES: hypothetical protein [unclassified Devosia]MBJ6985889.1 hypothetical protein [Devosia sp. MC521]QMW61266.1 hypothetical protein H4N61_09690 [Devosia sp. MC521]
MVEGRRKLVAGLFVLTIGSALLVLPPFVHLFNHPAHIFGIPNIVAYLFAVWALMIAATAVLNAAVGRKRGRKGEGG